LLYVDEALDGRPRRHWLAGLIVSGLLALVLGAMVGPMVACSRERSHGAIRSMRQVRQQRQAILLEDASR
jgi:hypothetical protein